VGLVTVLLLNFNLPSNPILSFAETATHLTRPQFAIALMGIAVILFTLRTWLAVKLIKKALLFLGKKSAAFSSNVFSEMLSRPSVALSSTAVTSKQYALITGANSKILGILGGFSGLISDLSVSVGLFIFFLITSPSIAISAAIVGLGFLFVLVKQTAGKGAELSRTIAVTEIKTRSVVSDALGKYRESFVSGNLGHFKREFDQSRGTGVEATANWTFLPNVGKYVLEAGVIIGGLLLGIVLFSFESPEDATSILSMFLAASTRLAPALIRIQQGIVSIKGHNSQKEELDELLGEIANANQVIKNEEETGKHNSRKLNRGVTIEVQKAFYRHNEGTPLIEEWDLRVHSGEFVALVGKSGSGKSSFADLVLGLIEPISGTVLLDGENPYKFILQHRGAVGYVPQYSSLSKGTIRSNLTLGLEKQLFTDRVLAEVLRASCVYDLVQSLPLGLDSQVDENGSNLSGGQRQRLAIAQALLRKPRLLILDEATASLDKKNEFDVIRGIRTYLPRSTILAITHSANLTQAADSIIEVKNSALRISKTVRK
jgi:ABC-type multidrug transport system fused ATPase/permease subunit